MARSRVHAPVWTHLLNASTPIGPHDLLIAATALAHGFEILTENLREFVSVPGLVVRRPTWPT
jgi:tRNA(fMet)-specific endonuclease VapC